MCVRCTHCGWLGGAEALVPSYYDPSPMGISLPAGSYREDHCPECGSNQDYLEHDFDLGDLIEVEDAEEYSAELSAFKDTLELDFSADGLIKGVTTSRGRWVFAG